MKATFSLFRNIIKEFEIAIDNDETTAAEVLLEELEKNPQSHSRRETAPFDSQYRESVDKALQLEIPVLGCDLHCGQATAVGPHCPEDLASVGSVVIESPADVRLRQGSPLNPLNVSMGFSHSDSTSSSLSSKSVNRMQPRTGSGELECPSEVSPFPSRHCSPTSQNSVIPQTSVKTLDTRSDMSIRDQEGAAVGASLTDHDDQTKESPRRHHDIASVQGSESPGRLRTSPRQTLSLGKLELDADQPNGSNNLLRDSPSPSIPQPVSEDISAHPDGSFVRNKILPMFSSLAQKQTMLRPGQWPSLIPDVGGACTGPASEPDQTNGEAVSPDQLEISKLKDLLRRMGEQLQCLLDEKAAAESRAMIAARDNESLESQIQGLKDDIASRDKYILELEAKQHSAEMVESLRLQAEGSRNKVTHLEQIICDLKADHEATVRRLVDRSQAAQLEASDLKAKWEAEKHKNEALEQTQISAEEAQSQIVSLQSELDKAKNEAALFESGLNTLSQKVQEYADLMETMIDRAHAESQIQRFAGYYCNQIPVTSKAFKEKVLCLVCVSCGLTCGFCEEVLHIPPSEYAKVLQEVNCLDQGLNPPVDPEPLPLSTAFSNYLEAEAFQ